MTEQEKLLEYLRSKGIGREEASVIAADDDLWVVPPESRVGLMGEEAPEAWGDAVRKLSTLAEDAPELFDNEAVHLALRDARERAEIALRRAQERLEEGEVE